MSDRLHRACLARRENDALRCAVCRLVWDVNDPAPPPCGQGKAPIACAPRITPGFVSGMYRG